MTALAQVSEHIYWLPPGEPVRPSLCAVVGERYTLMLDAGTSAAHARLFLDQLAVQGIAAPALVALTHWHWDHVFGADAIGVPVIAHAETAERLAQMALDDWSDAGLAARVARGDHGALGAEQLKAELPAPRDVRVALPTIIFEDELELDLGGGVRCTIRHVGGDHAPDSSVMFVTPDRVLFIGDCHYGSIRKPGTLTTERLLPLTEALLTLDPEQVISGHAASIMSGSDFGAYVEKRRLAAVLVARFGSDEAAALAAAEQQTGQPPGAELTRTVRALIAGETPG